MRNRIIIVAIAFVVLVGGSVAIILLVNKNPKLQNAVMKIANTNTTTSNTNSSTANINRNIPPSDSELIRFAARTFTELYGSFSSQNNGSNLTAATAYATADYAATLRQQVVVKQATPVSTTYTSVVTHALVFTLTKQTATTATVDVSTQQQTTTGSATTTATKDIVLDFEKSGANWLVNAATWK